MESIMSSSNLLVLIFGVFASCIIFWIISKKKSGLETLQNSVPRSEFENAINAYNEQKEANHTLELELTKIISENNHYKTILVELNESKTQCESLKDKVAITSSELAEKIAILESERNSSSEKCHILQLRIDELNSNLTSLKSKLEITQDNLREKSEYIASFESRIEEERNSFTKQLELLKNTKAEMTKEFENLSSKILEEQSKKFTQVNSISIDGIVKPFKTSIDEFKKRVEDVHKTTSEQSVELRSEVRMLKELNNVITLKTEELTNALSSNSKAQGDFGELILENTLEAIGFKKGIDYYTQNSQRNEDGKIIRPDVIVNLPGKKSLIVDSKVSLNDFSRYQNSQSEEERATFLKAHIKAVRAHISQLSEKKYHTAEQLLTVDFVLIFMPIESAYILTLKEDSKIVEDAYNLGILLVGSSNLLATLRVIKEIWRHEKQNQNTLEIAKEAGKLHDKIVGFVEDMEKLGKSISNSQDTYQRAMNKLSLGSGNIIRRAKKVKDLGAETTKEFDSKISVLSTEEDPNIELEYDDAS